MKIRFSDYMIRSWEMDDAPAIVKYANNKRIWRNLRDAFPHPYTLTDARDFLNKVTAHDLECVFAISTRTESIGGIEDVHRYSAELGYWLAEPFWNQGIMTQAVKRIVEYAFAKLNLYRIYAEPYEGNDASVRVLEKAGFKYEGKLRTSVCKDGKLLDQLLYAVVAPGRHTSPGCGSC
jgi:RimJ/RimL family protein N-acetyltransferase